MRGAVPASRVVLRHVDEIAAVSLVSFLVRDDDAGKGPDAGGPRDRDGRALGRALAVKVSSLPGLPDARVQASIGSSSVSCLRCGVEPET